MISVLVPYRGDGGWRDRVWNHCKSLWDDLPYELVIGEDPGTGPFSVARAFNDAAARATGDVFVLYGADQLPDADRIEWAVAQLTTRQWAALYANTAGYGEKSTALILAGADPRSVPLGTPVPFCTGILAVRRDSWIRFDERFTGWGCEDTAHRMALEALYGMSPEPTGTLRCLYHPAASREHFNQNATLVGEYMTATSEGTMGELVERLGLR